jgi:hypothetical protein
MRTLAHPLALVLVPSVLAGLVVSGCQQPDRLGGTPPLDPRRSTPQVHFEPVELDISVLRTHADYDAWEDQIIGRRSARMLYAVYRELLSRKRGDQRTFVRWMLLSYHEEIPAELRDRLRPFVDALGRNPETMGPDVRYLMGLMAWKRLTGGAGRPDIPVDFRSAAHVDTVVTNWNRLLETHPEWTGPREINAATIRERLAALKGTVEPVARPIITESTPTGIGYQVLVAAQAARAANSPQPADYKDFWDAFQPFRAQYEDMGHKRACEHVDKALRVLYHPVLLGDAVAHCALDRRNPFEAIDQVARMVAVGQGGGLEAVLNRLTIVARGNEKLSVELKALVAKVRTAATSDPNWAEHTGVTRWLVKNPS